MKPSPVVIRKKLCERLFCKNIVQNNFRGELAEQIIAEALHMDIEAGRWTHCSGDWAAWDFERNGIRVQVRQSSKAQSWDAESRISASDRKGSFSIKLNSGAYFGAIWKNLTKKRHLSQIYIFGWHEEIGDSANQFDLDQWVFFLINSSKLPLEKNAISVRQLNELHSVGVVSVATYSTLRDELERLVGSIKGEDIPEFSR